MSSVRTGINPVTIRGTDNRDGKPVAMAMGRLHIGSLKMVSAVMYDDTGGEPRNAEEAAEKIKAFAVFDEDLFILGLQHLFPAGEVDQAVGSTPPPDQDLIDLLRSSAKSNNRELIRSTLLRMGIEL